MVLRLGLILGFLFSFHASATPLLIQPLDLLGLTDATPSDEVKPPEEGAEAEEALSAPYADGKYDGMTWEVRFNLPECRHRGRAQDAWCKNSDVVPSAKISGVEGKLRQWMKDESVKSIKMAFYSFSNSRVRKDLCRAAEERDLKVTLYVDQAYSGRTQVRLLDECSENTRVVFRGKGPFGSSGAHLQHMKIVMASSDENPRPLHLMSEQAQADAAETRTYFSSSSANMSNFGTNIHFENWLFFDAPTQHRLSQENLCVFHSLDSGPLRSDFAKSYRRCIGEIEAEVDPDLQFFAVPAYSGVPRPYEAMVEIVESAVDEVLVAIHRLTTPRISDLFVDAKRRGARVGLLMDDDTLISGKEDGGSARRVGWFDVRAYRSLRRLADVYFMETNARTSLHLMHNKFIVVDEDKALFQGAGNFTGTALNIRGSGNYEQFYAIRVPEIVSAYHRAWSTLIERATPQREHRAYGRRDLSFREIREINERED
jgi:hypothetical protein